MDQTPNLQLPYIMPSQAQKHVTHNEAIRALDALVQMAVLDRDLATPPVSPADGDRYLVATGGLGGWAGKDGIIAAWQDGAWAFFTPSAGWLVWVADEDRLLCHDGAAFIDAAVHSVNPALLVGVNAIADGANRLSVKSPASLFDQEGGDHRMKINKAAAGDTASMLFQSGHSGRAEFGLTGDDDWTVKVSADGAAWVEALKVDSATGRMRVPAGLALGDDDQVVARRHIREKLVANRTYYIRTGGSDANTGLVDSVGGAFLTVQKAIDTVAALDLSIYDVTIQLGDGTYSGAVVVSGSWAGVGAVTLQGNAGIPANVLLDVTGIAVTVKVGRLTVKDLKLAATSHGMLASLGGKINFSNVDFGACTAAHMRAEDGGAITADGGYAISGGAAQHWRVVANAVLRVAGKTITLTGTPTIATFASVQAGAQAIVNGNIFAGSATGTRYSVSENAVISTAGGGASYIPGSIAGSAATGGQYT